MSYIKYQSKNIFYQELGSGRPLLLLHGNTASSNMFLSIAEEYSKQYKVILFDFLGHGKSDRIEHFPVDLWYEEAQQVIDFLRQKNYSDVYIIGSSGGALVATNVALERPDLAKKVIADSFEGEASLEGFTANIFKDRENSKQNVEARMFYEAMHGDDWESVVDNDTYAIAKHAKTIGKFFHKQLNELRSTILFTGSQEDEFVKFIRPNYYKNVYVNLIKKIGHGDMYIFDKGGHPAMLSNGDSFVSISKEFLGK